MSSAPNPFPHLGPTYAPSREPSEKDAKTYKDDPVDDDTSNDSHDGQDVYVPRLPLMDIMFHTPLGEDPSVQKFIVDSSTFEKHVGASLTYREEDGKFIVTFLLGVHKNSIHAETVHPDPISALVRILSALRIPPREVHIAHGNFNYLHEKQTIGGRWVWRCAPAVLERYVAPSSVEDEPY